MKKAGVIAFAVLLITGLATGAESKSAGPAKVENAIKETELAKIQLTPQAEKRLGIVLAAVEEKSVPVSRLYPGDVTAVPGNSLTVSAPFAGLLLARSNGMAQPGAALKQGQKVFDLQLLLTPADRYRLAQELLDAEAQVKQATANHEYAKAAWQRAEKLMAVEAASRRILEEAQTQVRVTEASLHAAGQRSRLLAGANTAANTNQVVVLSLDSPLDGILVSLSAMPGQSTPAGVPLFTVAKLDKVWVRVPVYAGELAQLRRNAEVRVGELAARTQERARLAQPIDGPPTANPDANSVDLYYMLDNSDGALRQGQRVGVTIPLQTEAKSLVVPWAAVIHDIYGGQWVYEHNAAQTYSRQRVQVTRVVGKDAVLVRGPKAGTQVVTDGAAELFGTEFGGK